MTLLPFALSAAGVCAVGAAALFWLTHWKAKQMRKPDPLQDFWRRAGAASVERCERKRKRGV